MKKIGNTGSFKKFYLTADLNTTNNCSKINFWCPTGMNPIKKQND